MALDGCSWFSGWPHTDAYATQIGSVEYTCVLKITGNQEGGALGRPREK